MSFLKKALIAVGIGVLGTIVAGVVAFLNEVHLEVSFDKLKDFKVTDLASYTKLGTALRIELETAKDQDYVAYWVDDDIGKPVIRSSTISYKNFRLNNRFAGKLVDDDDHAEYAITGYYNSDRLVFTHRGAQSGVGIYILDLIPLDGINANVYAGFAIIDDVVTPGASTYRVLQCPFMMIEQEAAASKYPSIDAAKKAFPFLAGACAPFQMPANITMAQTAK